MKKAEEKAVKMYNEGKKHSVSAFIDEDTIIAGYGKLDIDFEFPLPPNIIIDIYGTQSWTQWYRNKGLHKYISRNILTGETSLTPYMTDEEAAETLKENNNFTLEKL